MFYTGRYADKRINNEEYFVVRISLGLPKYELPYNIDYELFVAKPDYSSMESENFDELYLEKLERKRYALINQIASIKKLAGNKKIIFLCFEKVVNGNECHRILFGEWLKNNLGEDYQELDLISDKKKEVGYEQLSLF